jgi:hypothetical protein
MLRTFIDWTGGIGGAGVTILHWDSATGSATDAADALGHVATFATAISAEIPVGVNVQARAEVLVVDEANGDITGSWTVSPAPPLKPGQSAGVYSRLSGGCINWSTDLFVDSRRVKGRTYIVPVGQGKMQSDGTLDPAFLTEMNTAGVAMLGLTPAFSVWHRPSTHAAADGALGHVISLRVPDKAIKLSSRRD